MRGVPLLAQVSLRGAPLLALALALVAWCCALPGPRIGVGPSLRLYEVALEGDAARRASLRLVLDGLDADIREDVRRARGLYARALQIDSGNPYAYLALARHLAAEGEASLALEHLIRSNDLFSSYELASPRVEVHMVGLRGVVLRLDGRSAEAGRLLARAARSAPAIWGDGRLPAAELR